MTNLVVGFNLGASSNYKETSGAKVKIFISWSGERSQALAQALRDWLPMVLHYVEPWLSKSDIEAGDRWANEVAKELETTKFGIICITRENLESPWILFEAGALAKSMQEGRVIPLLLDIEFKDIAGPLAQFQAKKVEKAGLSDVIKSINNFSDTKLIEGRLTPQFETLWPALDSKVAEIPKSPTPTRHNRPQTEVLEELVSSIRGLDIRFRDTIDEPQRGRRRRKDTFMMMDMLMHGLDMRRNDPMRILLLVSMIKEELPWLYELGIDAYRAGTTGPSAKAHQAHQRFAEGIRILRRGPFMEMFGDKESHMVVREMLMLAEELPFSFGPNSELKPDVTVEGKTNSLSKSK